MYKDLIKKNLKTYKRYKLSECSYKIFQSYASGFPNGLTLEKFLNGIKSLRDDYYIGFARKRRKKLVEVSFSVFFNQIASQCFEIEPNNPNCIWEMTSGKKSVDNFLYNIYRDKLKTNLTGVPFTDEELSVIVTYLECKDWRSKSQSFAFHYEIYCPDPCAIKPCNTIDYAIQDSCQKEFPGAEENQFTCLCQQYYEWSSSSLKCFEEKVCAEHEGICRNGGICVRDSERTSEGFVCKCPPSHFGRRCEKLRDACIERYRENSKPGSQLCEGYDIEDGRTIEVYPGEGEHGRLGECKPVLGTDR